ncbi:hypothetical protein V1478_010799 [Vespula squamosa]|uniref:Uncharacterized protein n=1 Tax=Vespula squamosa TaxID=30214 RepID=A0ABD2AFE3_VESSQ
MILESMEHVTKLLYKEFITKTTNFGNDTDNTVKSQEAFNFFTLFHEFIMAYHKSSTFLHSTYL